MKKASKAMLELLDLKAIKVSKVMLAPQDHKVKLVRRDRKVMLDPQDHAG